MRVCICIYTERENKIFCVWGSQFLDQGLNLDHGSESLES